VNHYVLNMASSGATVEGDEILRLKAIINE
jgi:hypothetical protein